MPARLTPKFPTLSPLHQVLLVDDDARLGSLLTRYLGAHGVQVDVACDAISMNQARRLKDFDLVLLDIALPDDDGFEICRQLRAGADQTPVILLTARRDHSSRVRGLDLGADDYVVKPFSPRELLSRIRAVLRRTSSRTIRCTPDQTSPHFLFGPYKLNLVRRTLSRDGVDVAITTGEFAMLKIFVRHAGQTLSRDRLMNLMHGKVYEAFDRSLDVQISRLRKLIEPNSAKPTYIQTIWGKGYVFMPDAQN